MNLFEYVTLMEEMRTPFAYAGVGILAAFLIYIVLRMLGGLRRGGKKQLIHLGTTLVAAVAAFLLADGFCNHIVGALKVENLEGLILEIEQVYPKIGPVIRDALSNMNTDLIEYFLLLPCSVVLIPLLVPAIFLIINFVLKIVRFIVTKILRMKNAKTNSQRLGGVILSAIEAIIIIIMLSLPILGITSIIDRGYAIAIEAAEEEKKAELIEFYDSYFIPFTKNPAVEFIGALGAETMIEEIATVNIEDQRTNMRSELLGFSRLIILDGSRLSKVDFTSPTAQDKETITNVIDTLTSSPFTRGLIVGVVQTGSFVIENDLIPIEIGEEHAVIIDRVSTFLSQVSEDTLAEDLGTLKELYFAVCDSGVITEFKNGNRDILALLQQRRREGDDTVNRMVSIMKMNERTAPILTALTESLINSLSNEVHVGEGVTVSYDSLKNGLNDVLSVKKDNYETDEEYKEALTGTLDETLRDHGILLEEEIVESIADYVDTEYSHLEEFTDEEFNNVLLHYYDAYLNYLENGEIPDGLDQIQP